MDDGDVCAECNPHAKRVTWTNTPLWNDIEHVIDSFPPILGRVGLINRKISNTTLTLR